MTHSTYAFGDSPSAGVRLAVLARAFQAPSLALLDEVSTSPRTVLDLGCGPGHTTAMLAQRFGEASVTGVDESPSFVEQATAAYGALASFTVGDATVAPLPGAPADLIYARFLLAHLAPVPPLIASWLSQVAPGGLLALEELEWSDSRDPVLARYLQLSERWVGEHGSALFIGPQLENAIPGAAAVLVQRVYELDIPARQTASMSSLNLSAWGPGAAAAGMIGEDELAELGEQLSSRAETGSGLPSRWGIRQVLLRP